jgi:hypothetical protein
MLSEAKHQPFVTSSEAGPFRCATKTYFHGILQLRFAPLRMTLPV